MRDHVIVCGLNDEGLRVVERLHLAGVPVVVVDAEPDAGLVRELDGWGVRLLREDNRRTEALEAAGLATARALVCVEDDELDTLATALLARELRPDLRTVVALRNPSVARALRETGVVVLDVAQIAAPSVTEVCLGSRTHELRLGEAAYVVVEQPAPATGSFREVYGELAPLAVVPADGGPVVVAPGRDHVVHEGEQVTVVGLADDVRRAGLLRPDPGEHVYVGARSPGPARVRARRTGLLRFALRNADRRIKIALVALTGLVVVSVAVLLIGYREPSGRRMSVLDALYFTIETIGTVGYGDFYFRDQNPWLRAWAILLMVVGATLATVLFALLTNALIGQTLSQTLGRRRVTGFAGHVVVVGAGSVGVAVAEELAERGAEVVVVDADEHNRFRRQLRAASVPFVTGDATLPQTLRSVGLERAAAVAVLTSDDLANIETGLAVRDLLGETWDDIPVVLRLFDRRLQRTVAGSFGFREVRSPATLAAPWFVGAALGLDVLRTFYAGGRPMLVARLVVGVGGGLDGRPMHGLGASIRVVTLVRADGSTEPLPRRDTRLEAGDQAFLIGPYDELLALLRAEGSSLLPQQG